MIQQQQLRVAAKPPPTVAAFLTAESRSHGVNKKLFSGSDSQVVSVDGMSSAAAVVPESPSVAAGTPQSGHSASKTKCASFLFQISGIAILIVL